MLDTMREPIDALILNAGVPAHDAHGPDPGWRDVYFRTKCSRSLVLLEGMLSGAWLKRPLFSWGAKEPGRSEDGHQAPKLATSSIDDFAASYGQGLCGQKLDIFSVYGAVKFVGVLWMSSLARKFPDVRLLSISPGGTQGTEAANSFPTMMRIFYTASTCQF